MRDEGKRPPPDEVVGKLVRTDYGNREQETGEVIHTANVPTNPYTKASEE